MSQFFYWQQNGGEELWQEALADSRKTIIKERRPRFTTVLDLSLLINESHTREQLEQIKYSGPLYFDWDASDVSETIEKVQAFLTKLQEKGVDPATVSWYATGGRGFHAELPMGLFLSKTPKGGIAHLPAIYKEMAYDLYTDTMDMRVYSARRGRMWRTPNVERENGKYKVPVTAAEILAMTPEIYEQVCQAPRLAPPPAPAQVNPELAVLFAKAEQKVTEAAKKRGGASKDLSLLARHKGDYPPTLLKIMSGDGVAAGVGFHQLALQIAITTNALGKKEEEMLALSEGLIQSHVSDSNRYSTPTKRRSELSRMYHYTQDNVCYTYSKAAVKSVAAAEVDTSDLDGATEATGSLLGEAGDEDDGLLGSVSMRENGIYRKCEEGLIRISDLSFTNATVVIEAHNGHLWGYEVDVLLNGKRRSRQLLETGCFLNKGKYQQFALRNMGIMTGSDNHIAAVSVILREQAMKNGGITYVVHREGLDIIQNPESSERKWDPIWVSPNGVHTLPECTTQYQHRGVDNPEGMMKSDLWDAPPLLGSEEEAEVIEAFLDVNDRLVVGNLVGWMVGAFHRQIYHRVFGAFPVCQVFGQAGSGKTQGVRLFSSLHYYLQDPMLCQSDGSSGHGVEGRIRSSASIPIVLDEYKPREMRQGRQAQLLQIIRASYTGDVYSKGGYTQELGSGLKDIRTFSYCAPILFIGEAKESQTAVQDRCIAVPLSKGGIAGRRKKFEKVWDNRVVLGSLGKQLLLASMAMDFGQFRKQFSMNRDKVEAVMGHNGNDRPVYNVSVILTSLQFLGQVLHAKFGDRFDEKISDLIEAATDVENMVVVSPMAEAAKALNTLAFMSQTEDAFSEFGLRRGVDYEFYLAGHVDLKMQNCYVKYVAWCRNKGQLALYDNYEAFLAGLGHYAPVVNKACIDSPLKEGGLTKVYRFSLKALTEDGVEPFKGSEG